MTFVIVEGLICLDWRVAENICHSPFFFLIIEAMIRYGEFVQYIKDNHINWNTDLFEVLRGFFEQYYSPTPPCFPDSSLSESIKSIQGTVTIPEAFEEPQNGEYTDQDLINLFNT